MSSSRQYPMRVLVRRGTGLLMFALGALGVSIILGGFMAYLVPLPGLAPQSTIDRMVVSSIAVGVFAGGLVGFASLILRGAPAEKGRFWLALFLQFLAELIALFASLMVGFGR